MRNAEKYSKARADAALKGRCMEKVRKGMSRTEEANRRPETGDGRAPQGAAEWTNNLFERLCYFAVLSPFLAQYITTGDALGQASSMAANAAVGCVILAFVLQMRRTRRRVERIDGLRHWLNEAIMHDLKNPMTSIMASISCVAGERLDRERQDMLLNLALFSCRSQLALIDTLADTSRMENGELVLQRQSVDARGLLDSCIKDTRGAAERLGVKLIEKRSDSIPLRLDGDADLLSRVFSNLLLNAIKYTPKDGWVSLSARFEGGTFLFEISDTGIGIAPAHIKRLFKKYYRVEGASQGTRRGSGLGLYFCRMVVEAHGGKIGVESDSNGTRVAFSIPQFASHNGRSK